MITSTLLLTTKIVLFLAGLCALIGNTIHIGYLLGHMHARVFSTYVLHNLIMEYALFTMTLLSYFLISVPTLNSIMVCGMPIPVLGFTILCTLGVISSLLTVCITKRYLVLLDAILALYMVLPSVINNAWPWENGLIVFAAYAFARAIYVLLNDRNYRKNSLTQYSLHQAFEMLPAGVLIANSDDNVIACNDSMRSILYKLHLPSDSANASKLQQRLLKIATTQNPTHDNTLSQQFISVKEDEMRLFTHQDILIDGEKRKRIIAVDVTQEEIENKNIEATNRQLELTTKELNKSFKDIEKTAENEMNLYLRSRVHDVIGQRLSILHRYIEDGKDSPSDLEEIRTLIDSMLNELELDQEQDNTVLLASIIDSFSLVNVSIEIEGSLPEENETAAAFLQIIREAATNSTKHAKASTVFVSFSSNEQVNTLDISDNGTCTEESFQEHTGLKGMRHIVENHKGFFQAKVIHSSFVIHIEIPVAKS